LRRIYLELCNHEEVVEVGEFWSKWLNVFAGKKVSIPASVKVSNSWFNCSAHLIRGKRSWQAFLDWNEEIKQTIRFSCGLGLLKPFYMELTIRGLSESVVDEVLIVTAAHSVGRLNPSLLRRLNAIAIEHSAINGRLLPLRLKYLDSWEQFFNTIDFENIFLLDKSGVSISKINFHENCCFIVGPEGGFSNPELDYFQSKGISKVSLGEEIFSSWFSAISFASFLTLQAGSVKLK
jgi:RsmE family RNA methyltransferase